MKKITAYLFGPRIQNFSDIYFEGVDVVNYSFALVKDGKCYIPERNCLDKLLKLEGRKFEVGLSIGGWGADGFSDAVLTEESRKIFVDSIIEIVKEKNLAGVDLDWEYPAIAAAGIKARKEDTQNFTLFMELLRQELDKLEGHKYLSFAVGTARECAE